MLSSVMFVLAVQASPATEAVTIARDPQAGATPRVPPPSAPLPPAPTPAPLQTAPLSPPIRSIAPPPLLRAPTAGPPAPRLTGALPLAEADPMNLDLTNDPVLQVARATSSIAEFRDAIAAAVTRNPALDEAVAIRDEAEGARNEARARRAPVADIGFSSFRILSRSFSSDPDNVLERLRPNGRTDATVHLQQPVFDFGAGLSRARAGQARLDAAAAAVDDAATQLALRAVSAWYEVYGYRALVRLGEEFAVSQRALHAQVEQRVKQGVSAPGDVAQVDSYIAVSDSQLADFRRQRASAEAQYVAIIGSPAPAGLGRAPEPDLSSVLASHLATVADDLPSVRAAKLGAEAARRDVKAARADILPQVFAGADYGRYGVFESPRDYDLRGNLSLSMRFGGGAAQRLEQAQARASGAEARSRRVRDEATRDAQIAWSDVATLTEAHDAIEANYVASRRSRDVLAERFRVARGTLFDLVIAENNFFSVAARYIQATTELDSARYALLARTGQLLSTLHIESTNR